MKTKALLKMSKMLLKTVSSVDVAVGGAAVANAAIATTIETTMKKGVAAAKTEGEVVAAKETVEATQTMQQSIQARLVMAKTANEAVEGDVAGAEAAGETTITMTTTSRWAMKRAKARGAAEVAVAVAIIGSKTVDKERVRRAKMVEPQVRGQVATIVLPWSTRIKAGVVQAHRPMQPRKPTIPRSRSKFPT